MLVRLLQSPDAAFGADPDAVLLKSLATAVARLFSREKIVDAAEEILVLEPQRRAGADPSARHGG